jgi:hypothetical protein
MAKEYIKRQGNYVETDLVPPDCIELGPHNNPYMVLDLGEYLQACKAVSTQPHMQS